MAELLAAGGIVATQDAYADALTLGPAPHVEDVRFSVIGSQPAIVQVWRYTDESRQTFTLDPLERTIPGNSVGLSLSDAAGVRFRSAVAGSPTNLIGELRYAGDPALDVGEITPAAISSGGVTTPPGGWTQTIVSAPGSGTFLVPLTATVVVVVCLGAGGGGASGGGTNAGTNGTGGAGGGGGACSIVAYDASQLRILYPAGVPYTVGLGGAGGAQIVGGGNVNVNPGSSGGATTFGSQSGGGGGGAPRTGAVNQQQTGAGGGGVLSALVSSTGGNPPAASVNAFGVELQGMTGSGSLNVPPGEYGGACGGASNLSGIGARGGNSLFGGGGGASGGSISAGNVPSAGGIGGKTWTYAQATNPAAGGNAPGTFSGPYAGSGGDGGDARAGAIGLPGQPGAFGGGGGGGGTSNGFGGGAGGAGGSGRLVISYS